MNDRDAAAAAALQEAELEYDRAYERARAVPLSKAYQADLVVREGALQQAYRDAGLIPPCVWTQPIPDPDRQHTSAEPFWFSTGQKDADYEPDF